MKVTDFDLTQTLECGQCFNFEKIDENEYIVVAFERCLHVRQEGEELIFENAPEKDIADIWIPYFDLNRDYGQIKARISEEDPRLSDITEKYYGIRILNQDFTETLISFIISQNKNIPHIKQIIRNISTAHGRRLGEFNGREYFSFPDVNELNKISEDEFRSLKTGFRAPYLRDAVDRLHSGEISEELLRNMPYDDARECLKKIKGVGDKVANCVLLFSLGFRAAFPVDVWIRRIIDEMYEGDVRLAIDKFGELGGYAQQYLFMYIREKSSRS